MSNLKRANNLLNNPEAERHQLEDILAELQITLTTKHHTLDPQVKHEYATTIALLSNKISQKKDLEKEIETEKRAQNPTSQRYFDRTVRVPPIIEPPKPFISMGMLAHYTKRMFLPENPKVGDKLWLDNIYLDSSYDLFFDNSTVFTPIGDIQVLKDKPDLWIGDIRIDSIETITIHPVYGEISPKKVLKTTPVINFERVEVLHLYFSQNEYRPSKMGEFGWTRSKPQIAKLKVIPTYTHVPSYIGQNPRHSQIHIHSGSEYLIKFSGFVVFVDGVSEDDLWQRSVFDIEYYGDSRNGKSGRGKLITNYVRELVTRNIEHYRRLEKELTCQ
jgi:hypothetical protein